MFGRKKAARVQPGDKIVVGGKRVVTVSSKSGFKETKSGRKQWLMGKDQNGKNVAVPVDPKRTLRTM